MQECEEMAGNQVRQVGPADQGEEGIDGHRLRR